MQHMENRGNERIICPHCTTQGQAWAHAAGEFRCEKCTYEWNADSEEHRTANIHLSNNS
jgi:ribosomal protein L37AE/L43A